MRHLFTVNSIIECKPLALTKKHEELNTQRLTSIFKIDESHDLVDYYRWFFYKEYKIKLLKPLREPHVTLINKYLQFIKMDNMEEFLKYDGTNFEVEFDLRKINCNHKHVWIDVSDECRERMYKIIDLISIERPKFGLHMTIGSYGIHDESRGLIFKKYLHEQHYIR